MQIHTTADLMNAAAAALARRNGDAFDTLIQTNRDWLQSSEERDANEAALNVMQEAAYQLAEYDEPSQYDDGSEWDEDAA
jgi:hypothetical protein